MTVTDLSRTAETTPQSQDIGKLRLMLEEPALIGFRGEILAAIERLAAEQESQR